MTIHEHRGARRRLGASQRRSAAEFAALARLGRTWREEWRADKAAAAEKANGAAASPARPTQRERKATTGEDFAAGIARAEFGRFYWNAKLGGQLKAAMARRRQRDGRKRE